ncbi:uncharacterized protein KY384_001236 [Bacidia gigantensis]|uniref:uncharacterized protein n=1 Tax=Bacidia gigantensis TaxID=2732470 RepID=UPI001D03EA2C|nr:uncharacterized protein KY384_001236 [Bacidia gigantensis]KAG8534391.1 hypothetical protein KY384_001236 [Bacidia gigantensis]
MVIRLGIIGLSAHPSAWATMAHIGPLSKEPLSDKYQLTAVATSSPDSAKAAAKAFGLPEDKAYSSLEAIAQDKDVDMIVVSVRVPMHHQLTMPALKAGKDAFVEWPLGANLAQAEEMAALAKQKGLKTAVGLQARANPVIQKAKEIIDSGALGRVLTTNFVGTTTRFINLPEKAVYVNDPKSGADIVSIPILHTLDALCYLLGEFKWLAAALEKKFPEVQFTRADGTKTDPVPSRSHDSVNIQGELESGAPVSFAYHATTRATPDHLTWVISGEKASLKFDGDHATVQMAQTKLSLYEVPQDDAAGLYEKNVAAPWKDIEVEANMAFGGVGEVYQAFAEGDGGKGIVVDFEEAVKRHRLLDAIFRSAEKGTRETY